VFLELVHHKFIGSAAETKTKTLVTFPLENEYLYFAMLISFIYYKYLISKGLHEIENVVQVVLLL